MHAHVYTKYAVFILMNHFAPCQNMPEAVSVTVIGIYYWCIYNQCTNSTSQHHTAIKSKV